jgi:hypothetical protein
VPFEEFLLEYFGFVQKNYQPHYFEVSDSNNCGELLSESTTQHGALYFTWKIAWVLVGCSGGCSDQASSGESRVSEFGGLIHGDDTSYVHNRGMITGFHHAKLWDPGGILSLAWICPCRVVLVSCKSVQQWSPWPVNYHWARLHFLLSTRAQMHEEFYCRTSLDLVAYRGYSALTLASTSSWEHLWNISQHRVTIICDE